MQDVQRQACGHAWKELEQPPPPPRIGRRAQVLLSGRLCLQCWAAVGLWLASGTRVKSQLFCGRYSQLLLLVASKKHRDIW